MRPFRATVINPGAVKGRVLVLDDALSFWGGFDPADGTIIDRHHPQAGKWIAGKIVVMPHSRGSAGTPAGIAESIRCGNGPIAIILGQVDVNLAIGAMVADSLYGGMTPILVAEPSAYASISPNVTLSIELDGAVAAEK